MKHFVLSVFVLLFLFPLSGSAQMMGPGMIEQGWGDASRFTSEEISGVVQEILDTQKIQSVDKISCNAVTDVQSETLGDAVMGAMIGNEKQHELMDQMMGGEGSQSLKAAHILMGQQYLGCGNANMGGMMGPMGMMFGNFNGWSGILNGWSNPWSWLGTLGMIAWIAVGVLFAVWLIQKIRKER